jgi:hypothetical protein
MLLTKIEEPRMEKNENEKREMKMEKQSQKEDSSTRRKLPNK